MPKNKTYKTKNRKKNNSKLSSEAIRKKKAARAKIASFFGAFTAVALVVVVLAVIPKPETTLAIDDAGYEQIGTAQTVSPDENVTDVSSTETENPEVSDVVPAVNANIELNDNMLAVGKLKFSLSESYPIDMIIGSEYALVYDVLADEILYAKNADEKCYPASTTKLLTASVALDNSPDDFIYNVGEELSLVNAGSSLAMLYDGNQLTQKNMIDALMLPSGNDAAYSTAANIGRLLLEDNEAPYETAVDVFVDSLNETARLIGCENTHFANPDGFHDDNHYTNLLDMLRIALYAQKFDMILESVDTPYLYGAIESGQLVEWRNSNLLIQESSTSFNYYADGMKTGMTDEAGYCVVASATRYDRPIICMVFGGEYSDVRWNDAVALIDAAFVQIKKGIE